MEAALEVRVSEVSKPILALQENDGTDMGHEAIPDEVAE